MSNTRRTTIGHCGHRCRPPEARRNRKARGLARSPLAAEMQRSVMTMMKQMAKKSIFPQVRLPVKKG